MGTFLECITAYSQFIVNAILETLEPQQAVYVLNSFYSVFVECIHAEAGTSLNCCHFNIVD